MNKYNYDIFYTYEDENGTQYNVKDEFCGTTQELNECIDNLHKNNCYNVEAVCTNFD